MIRATRSLRHSISKKFRSSSSDDTTESRYGDVFILGLENVGKTSIVNRFVHNYFTEQYIPTISTTRYEVDALLEVAEEQIYEGKEEEPTKKIILKKSFKKSVIGKNRPKAQKQPTIRLERVLSTSGDSCDQDGNLSVGREYRDGTARGLKRLKFTLVDTPSDLSEMHPMSYQAMLHNASGFFLVCSYDNADSLASVEKNLKMIRASGDSPTIVIVNKSDICEEERVLDEKYIRQRAKELNVKFCCASMASKGGYEEMARMLLNEINISAVIEEYEESLPENEAYFHDDEYY